MGKKRNDYFELVKNQTSYCVQAAKLLEKMFGEFSSESVISLRDQIHKIEHKADELRHDILLRLSSEFITPIDQADILLLVQIIDDVTDALDEVVFDFYMYGITKPPRGIDSFSGIVTRCVETLYRAVEELPNFKKPEKLRSILVSVNSIETEADEAHIKAVYDLFKTETDFKTLISNNAVFESLENCCDLCESAADVIEQIVMKNT